MASDRPLGAGRLHAAAVAVLIIACPCALGIGLGTIKGNLFWEFATTSPPFRWRCWGLLNPLVAGTAMAFSSAFVITNRRLRRFDSVTEDSIRS